MRDKPYYRILARNTRKTGQAEAACFREVPTQLVQNRFHSHCQWKVQCPLATLQRFVRRRAAAHT